MSLMSRFTASRTVRVALAGLVVAPFAAAPAMADGPRDPRFMPESSRNIYVDRTGRYYVRHGERVYVQYFERRDDRNWRRDRREERRDPPRVVETRRDRTGDAALAAGIAGLAVGAIIAGISSQNQQPVIVQEPRHTGTVSTRAYPPAPVVQSYPSQPKVITYNATMEPWTDGWREWCTAKYRSFNASTGTFRGYDGLDHFCVVK